MHAPSLPCFARHNAWSALSGRQLNAGACVRVGDQIKFYQAGRPIPSWEEKNKATSNSDNWLLPLAQRGVPRGNAQQVRLFFSWSEQRSLYIGQLFSTENPSEAVIQRPSHRAKASQPQSLDRGSRTWGLNVAVLWEVLGVIGEDATCSSLGRLFACG